MSDATTARRREFEQLVYKRLAEHGIGAGQRYYKVYGKYMLIRQIYRRKSFSNSR
jgi:hypothetical protein